MAMPTPSISDSEPHAIEIRKSPDGITTIGINRIHKKNSIDSPTSKKLHAAFLSFENDPTQKVCVFHGLGGTFSSGFDLSDIATWDTSPTPGNGGEKGGIARKQFHPVHGLNPAPLGPGRLQLTKPVICAISGFAVAGGLELATLADLRVVEEDAVFGVFNRRMGVPLLDGLTVRLPAIIGLGRALDLILTGRAMGAQEAERMGLANRVVGKGKAFEEAMGMARALTKFPQEGMNADRKSVYYAAFEAQSLEDGLKREFDAGVEVADLAIGEALRFSQKGNRKRGSSL